MKRFIALFGFTLLAGKLMAAPAGTVFCEIPDKTKTIHGESNGMVVARVESDTTLANQKLDFQADTDPKKRTLIEKVYGCASPKYKPKNEAYKNYNKFSFSDESCKYEWLLPKRLGDRVNKFTGYLQQICFSKKGDKTVKADLDTLELECRMNTGYKIAEADKSKTALALLKIAESANYGNGQADVRRFSVKNYNETRAVRELGRELPNNEGCKFETLEATDSQDVLVQLKQQTDDSEVVAVIEELIKKKNLHALLGRVNTEGESESCSIYYFRAYTKDGYLLELNYEMTT